MAPRRGRPPSLSARGAWVGGGAAVLAVTGLALQSAQLLGLGIVVAGVLFVVVLAQYPTALFIWRRHVELAWRVTRPAGDPALYAGRPLELTIELRNRAPRSLGVATVRPVVSLALDVESTTLPTPAEGEAARPIVLLPRAVGLAMLHGASVTITDALGLTKLEAYFPSPIALPVVPRAGASFPPPVLVRTAGPERAQRSSARQSGQGGDLRELRDHRPGDPWKQIAWKATARRGRVMVRELERETQTSHLFVLDVSGGMRRGAPGGTPLDVAIEVAARLTRGALDSGDRVGLCTVDGRVIAHVPPSDRPGQRTRISDVLAQANAAYDEDVTDVSDAELCAVVARYLLLQEGEETRVAAPTVDDPRWSRLVAGPTGELYDLDKLLRVVDASRRRLRSLVQPGRIAPPRALDPQMAALRQLCRERAIPLPVREHDGRGAEGLVAALSPQGGKLPDRVVVLSLLDGLDGTRATLELALRQSLARAARRGTRVLWVAPVGPPLSAHRAPVTELLGHEHLRELATLKERGARLGLRPQPCEEPVRFHLDARASRRALRVA